MIINYITGAGTSYNIIYFCFIKKLLVSHCSFIFFVITFRSYLIIRYYSFLYSIYIYLISGMVFVVCTFLYFAYICIIYLIEKQYPSPDQPFFGTVLKNLYFHFSTSCNHNFSSFNIKNTTLQASYLYLPFDCSKF